MHAWETDYVGWANTSIAVSAIGHAATTAYVVRAKHVTITAVALHYLKSPVHSAVKLYSDVA